MCANLNLNRPDPAGLPGVAGAAAWLVFQLGEQQFGIDARKVCECVHYAMLGAVADGPAVVRGVALWRGQVLSLVDLRAGFDGELPAALTDVIILTLSHRLVGVAVDGALDVITLAPWQIDPLRHAGGALLGTSLYRERVLLLVDFEVLLADAGGPRRTPRGVRAAGLSESVPAG